jgi:membrane protein
MLIGLYLGKSAIGSSYGAAGSLVVLLVWVYYSAQVLFFGAELAHTHAERRAKARARAPGQNEASAVEGGRSYSAS